MKDYLPASFEVTFVAALLSTLLCLLLAVVHPVAGCLPLIMFVALCLVFIRLNNRDSFSWPVVLKQLFGVAVYSSPMVIIICSAIFQRIPISG